MAVSAERQKQGVVEYVPFIEQIGNSEKIFMYNGLASIKGSVKENPYYEGEVVKMSHTIQLASIMKNLGINVSFTKEEIESFKKIWNENDETKQWVGSAMDARNLGFSFMSDEDLIDDRIQRLERARTRTDKHRGRGLSNMLVDLKKLGVDASVPRDIQIILEDIQSLRNEGGWLSTGRILPTDASNAKLLGLKFYATNTEWDLMKKEVSDKKELAKEGSYDGMFWYSGGLLDLAIIDSENPRIEDGKIVYS